MNYIAVIALAFFTFDMLFLSADKWRADQRRKANNRKYHNEKYR